MTQQEIQAYNKKLVNEIEVVTIIEYVKNLNDKFYHIDISFIDDFIELVDKEGFIINHDMLQKYQVLKIKDTHDIKRLLEQYEFIEDQDYRKFTPGDLRGGYEYMLKGEIFKMILMRSRNTRKYADYYIFLEKCIKHYNDYQLIKLQNKIDKLESTLKDRVIPPTCKHKIENLVIVYLEEEEEFQYYVIRGQIKHIKKQLRRLNKKEEDIIAAIDTPNSVDLWINIKEELDEYLKLDKMIANNKIINTGYFSLKKYFRKRIHEKNQSNKWGEI